MAKESSWTDTIPSHSTDDKAVKGDPQFNYKYEDAIYGKTFT
jgi:hypothetical protein